jgi:hypothetical protein
VQTQARIPFALMRYHWLGFCVLYIIIAKKVSYISCSLKPCYLSDDDDDDDDDDDNNNNNNNNKK